MLGTSATFEPFDRDTGAEISFQEQKECRLHYAIIKSYIDEVESHPEFALQWTRKKLRCSTSELLDAIEKLSDDIRQKQGTIVHGNTGSDGDNGIEYEASHIVDAANAGILTPQFYQQAVNLLHELMSRLVNVEGKSTGGLQLEMLPDYVAQESFVPGSSSNSSEGSTALSNLTRSLVTSESLRTGSSRTSDDLNKSIAGNYTSREPLEKANPVTFEKSFDEQLSNELVTSGKVNNKAADDWVFEYLRGGWLTNTPPIEPTVSPAFTMSEESSPSESFRKPQRTNSDEIPLYDNDTTPRRFSSYTIRKPRHGLPIPTMTSRFMARAGSEDSFAGYVDPFGHEFFKTPRSIMSGSTLYITPDSGPRDLESKGQSHVPSAWNRYLRDKGIIPNPFDEMDWSGRGQHAEFDATEESEIPLTLEKALGHSATALVESVRCRRIRLARKTVTVTRRLKREEAIKEVEHLQRLRHPHIIRVVGTYTLPRKLCILLYPVADYTLDQFLESIQDGLPPKEQSARLYSISTFLRCLAKALAYIHENAMKHMDIKPKNLLIRDMQNSTICNQGQYKIYIADFGIARSYRSIDDCDTESPTAFTRVYAAPEVVAQERRDQKADIFSLGAVYAELLSVLAVYEPQGISNLSVLADIRENNPTSDRSYHANVPKIQTWLRSLSITSYGFETPGNYSHITELAAQMLSIEPAKRPTASTVVNNMPFLAFCCDVNGGREPFEAADRSAVRQLYDRAFEISEANLRYFRCMVDGCVKVYWSREKLEYHEEHGHSPSSYHSPSVEFFPESVGRVTLSTPEKNETVSGDKTCVMNHKYDEEKYNQVLHQSEITQHLRWS